jgi:hypothetical protein
MQENIKRIGRICKKHLGVYKVHGEKFKRTHMHNTQKEPLHTWRRRKETPGVFANRDTKLSISRLIMAQHEKTFRLLLSIQNGLD